MRRRREPVSVTLAPALGTVTDAQPRPPALGHGASSGDRDAGDPETTEAGRLQLHTSRLQLASLWAGTHGLCEVADYEAELFLPHGPSLDPAGSGAGASVLVTVAAIVRPARHGLAASGEEESNDALESETERRDGRQTEELEVRIHLDTPAHPCVLPLQPLSTILTRTPRPRINKHNTYIRRAPPCPK